MAISNQTVRTLYDGDDSTTSFAIPFASQQTSYGDLLVYLRAADGTETLQTISSDYTVSGTNVVMTTAPATGEKLLLIRANPATSTLDLDPNEAPDVEAIEDQIDKLTALVQELREKVDRAPKFKITTAETNPELAEPTTNKYLQWDANGDIINSDGTGDVESLNDVSPTTTKGDLLVRDATELQRLPVGTNDQVLTADSTQDLGVRWGTVASEDTNLANIDVKDQSVVVYTDFMSGNMAFEGWTVSTGSGGAAAPMVAGNSLPGHPGVLRLSTETNSSGRAYAAQGVNMLHFGQGESVTFDAVVAVNAVPTVAEDFTCYIGCHSGTTSSPSRGVGFAIDRTENANNWLCMTDAAGSNFVDSGEAIVADSMVHLRIEINGAGTEALFYIDDTLVHTETTNLPSTSSGQNGCYWIASLFKQAGTTARYLYLDKGKTVVTFDSPRIGTWA